MQRKIDEAKRVVRIKTQGDKDRQRLNLVETHSHYGHFVDGVYRCYLPYASRT